MKMPGKKTGPGHKPRGRLTGALASLWQREDGGLVGNIIFFGIIIAIMAIIVIDGISIFSTYQLVDDTTEEAAKKAKFEYEFSKSDYKAENAAADICEEKGLVFEEFTIIYDFGHTFRITCSKESDTYVFKYIPWLKDLSHQQKSVITSEV